MKVCVIGGGSTYTPELLEGLLDRRETLGLDEIHLHDVDQRRLEVLGPLAARMAGRAGPGGVDSGVRITWGTDRLEAIAGSTFVVSQMRVGGMDARGRDEQLGREFDLVGQETVGVGGLANALRTVPVALAIAADIAEAAPDATLLNFTNPAGLVTEALVRHSLVQTIGLCNIPWTMRARIASSLDVEPATVQLESVGLNHLSWVRRVVVDGQDRTAEVIEQSAAAAERRAGSDDPAAEPAWSGDELRELGAMPNPYLRYFRFTDRWVERQHHVPTRAAAVAEIEAALLEQYADPDLATKPPELAHRGGAFYSEAAAELMVDLVAGRGAIHVVNTRNDGAIPGLADDTVVEVAARIGNRSVAPIAVEPLRPDVAELIRAVKASELATIAAAVDGDHAAGIDGLVAHPLGPTREQAPAVWARLLELNRGWLGRLES